MASLADHSCSVLGSYLLRNFDYKYFSSFQRPSSVNGIDSIYTEKAAVLYATETFVSKLSGEFEPRTEQSLND